MRWSAVVVLLLAVAFAPVGPEPGRAHAQSTCGFQLGFAALTSQIPTLVGPCTDDETHGANGDGLQLTANGLLVWRKSDNWTAFTNGSQSWVNGPFGLQQRANTRRFWWEANPDQLAIVPAPESGDRCHTGGLSLTLLQTDAGAGNLAGTFALTNELDVACTFDGYPGAQLLDADQNPLPTTVTWGGGYFASDPPPAVVSVAPQQAGLVRIHWSQVPVGAETSCSESTFLALTPPDEYVTLVIPATIRACGGGALDVSAMQPSPA